MKRLIVLLVILLLITACESATAPTPYTGCVHAVMADGGETCL